MKTYDVVIESKNSRIALDLKELWEYRELTALFVKRNFISYYKQTVLGPAWAIIQPLLTTIIFTIVFGKLAGLAADGYPSFLFYMSGTIVWTFFSNSLIQTSDTFVSNYRLFGKVYFPRLVMPIAIVLTNLISFAIQCTLFFCFLLYYWALGMVQPNLYCLLFPMLVVQAAVLSLGSGIIIAALTTKYRDLRMVVGFCVQLWMYGTPVAYDLRIIPREYMGIYMMNPMTPIVTALRYAFLGIGEFQLRYYIFGWISTITVLLVGVFLFSHVEKTFMDTV